jgi:glycosyltransferase involved in cell wall biosynthesis
MKVAILALGAVSSDTAGRTYLEGLLGPLGEQPDLDVTVHLADRGFAVPDSCAVERHRLPAGPEPLRKVLGEAWLARRLSRAGYDVLLAPFNFLPVTWRGPSVVVQHNVLSFENRLHGQLSGLRAWYRPRALAISLRRATVIVAVSSYLRRLLLEHHPEVAADRVRVIPYGVSAHLRGASAVQPGPRNGTTVLVVSTLDRHKRVDQAIEVFAAARARFPEAILEIAGPARKHERAPLEARAQELGVAGSVRFLGNLDHGRLADRYAAADAVLYLSEIESFGLPVIEAMAFGVPVVAKPIEALVEVGEDVPFWVDQNASAEEIGATLERVLADPELRRERSEAGARRARAFSVERSAELTAEALRSAARVAEQAPGYRPVESRHFEGSVRGSDD